VLDFVNYKKGALDSQSQVIKLTSCLPIVGGSLRVLRLLPPLKLVAIKVSRVLFQFLYIYGTTGRLFYFITINTIETEFEQKSDGYVRDIQI
jgi:hypothetical protein